MSDLTEEQRLLRDSAARFMADEYGYDKRQRIVATEAGFRAEHWRKFAEMGWLAARFPENLGGLGGSLADTAVISEQFGRALMMSPFFATVILGGGALLISSNEEKKREIIPAVAEGRLRLTVGLAESGFTAEPLAVATTARPAGAGYVIDGAKCHLPYAVGADFLIISARLSDHADGPIGLLLVPASAKGVELKPYVTADGGRAADAAFNGVAVGRDALLAEADDAGLLETLNDEACAMLLAEACGLMWNVHDHTLAYFKTRTQFGATLGSFQALQHRLVDVYIKCQLAQSMAWDAVAAVAEPSPDRASRVAAAKAYVGPNGRAVGKEGIQLHGGIGMTADIPVGPSFKRLCAIDLLHGDADYHLARFKVLSARS